MPREISGPPLNQDSIVAILKLEPEKLYRPSDVARLNFDPNEDKDGYNTLRVRLGRYIRYHAHGSADGQLGSYNAWYGETWRDFLDESDIERARHLIPEKKEGRTIMPEHGPTAQWRRPNTIIALGVLAILMLAIFYLRPRQPDVTDTPTTPSQKVVIALNRLDLIRAQDHLTMLETESEQPTSEILGLRAELLFLKGDLTQALILFSEAMALAELEQNQDRYLHLLTYTIQTMVLIGDVSAAADFSVQMDLDDDQGERHFLEGVIHLAKGEWPETENKLLKASTRFQEAEDMQNTARTALWLSLYYWLRDDALTSRTYLQQAQIYRIASGDGAGQAVLFAIETLLDDRDQWDYADLCLDRQFCIPSIIIDFAYSIKSDEP